MSRTAALHALRSHWEGDPQRKGPEISPEGEAQHELVWLQVWEDGMRGYVHPKVHFMFISEGGRRVCRGEDLQAVVTELACIL